MNLSQIVSRVNLISGWFYPGQMLELYPHLRELKKEHLILEVGTYFGRSALFFALSAPDTQVITIDVIPTVDQRVMAEDNVVQLLGDSVEVGLNWDGPSPDFIFIDGNHEYEAVKRDIAAWYPRLTPGGVIAFHDYYSEPGINPQEGVKQAVDEWKHNCITISEKEQLFIGRKPND